MRSFARVCLTVGALSLGLLLTACEDFDPTAIFDADIFNPKKKLPGERRTVFPDGTPGVTQGVPPEMVKGHEAPAAAPEAASKESGKDAQKQAAADPGE